MERVQEMGETVETVLGMWDGIQIHSSFHTDEKEMEYKDLLTSTRVECHMDPTISKASTGKRRTVSVCVTSENTVRGPLRALVI